MSNNQSNSYTSDGNDYPMASDTDGDNGNDYPMDSVTNSDQPYEDSDAMRGAQDTNDMVLMDSHSGTDEEKEKDIRVLEDDTNQQQNEDNDIDEDTGNHGDDNGGSHMGSHGDIGNDIGDDNGLVRDDGSLDDQNQSNAGDHGDQTVGNIGDDSCDRVDDGHTMVDNGGTMEDDGGTMVYNGGSMGDSGGSVGDDGGTMEDDGGTTEDDGSTKEVEDGTMGDSGHSVGDNGCIMNDDGRDMIPEYVQESLDINKSVINDSNIQQVPKDDHMKLNTTDNDPSVSEEESVTMETNNEETGQESDGTQDNNDDDIVTFEEFKNKMNQEGVNMKPSQTGASVPARQSYHSYHNYALTECGASVLESNKEAKNVGSILLENKDLYMLNPCSAKIWFVIELCELVSVSILEISCFELFSSVPETIAVYTSDSYPNPVWEKLGIFTLNDERGTQKFPLEESVYTKYIKFEMLTHYGTEHYCPITTIKVLGSTMIEEYEYTESQRDGGTSGGGGNKGEQQYDKIISNDNDKTQSQEPSGSNSEGNPIKAATDAILKFVGKAVNGFMVPLDEEYDEILDSYNNEQQLLLTTTNTNHMTSSSINVVAVENDPNSQDYTESDKQTSEKVDSLSLITPEVTETPETQQLEPDHSRTSSNHQEDITTARATSVSIDPLGPTDTLILSTTDTTSISQAPETSMTSTVELESSLVTTPNTQTTIVDETLTSISTAASSLVDGTTLTEGNPSHQPIPTLKPEDGYNAEPLHLQYSNTDESRTMVDSTTDTTIVPTSTLQQHPPDVTTANTGEGDSSDSDLLINNTETTTPVATNDNNGNDDTTGNSITSSVNKSNTTGTNIDTIDSSTIDTDQQHALEDTNTDNVASSDTPNSVIGSSVGGTTREKSVFVRLSNRINILEVNMTLFDTYLDQISQSLKKNKNRTEDMQKSLERRISILNETIQHIKDKVNINASMFDTVLSSVTELNRLYLSQQENWSDFINYVSTYLIVIILLQTLIVAACCISHRSRSNQFKELQKSLHLLQTQIHDMNTVMGNSTTLPINHHHSNSTINKSSNSTVVLNNTSGHNHSTSISTPVTISGGQHRRHHSFGSNEVHSCSSPDLRLAANDDQKWKKVEHKKHKKSTCKKSEQ